MLLLPLRDHPLPHDFSLPKLYKNTAVGRHVFGGGSYAWPRAVGRLEQTLVGGTRPWQ